MPIGLQALRIEPRSYLFRAVVLGTLLIVAAIFSVGGNEQVGAPHASDETHREAVDVGPHKSLWVRTLDDAPGFWTAVLAGLTFVLAGVGVGQIYFLARTDETARLSANAALKAANAAEKSATLAEAALIGAEAPFIFATIERSPEYKGPDRGGRTRFATVTLHNYGRSPAIIRDVYTVAVLSREMPNQISFPPPHTALHKTQIIPAGQSGEPWIIPEGAVLWDGWSEGVPSPQIGTRWVMGQLRYTDLLGGQYLSGFCFALNEYSRRFYGQGGLAYNYRRGLSQIEAKLADAIDAGTQA